MEDHEKVSLVKLIKVEDVNNVKSLSQKYKDVKVKIEQCEDITKLLMILKTVIVYVFSQRYILDETLQLCTSNYDMITKVCNQKTRQKLTIIQILDLIDMNILMHMGMLVSCLSEYTNIIPLYVPSHLIQYINVYNIHDFNIIQWYFIQKNTKEKYFIPSLEYAHFINWKSSIPELYNNSDDIYNKIKYTIISSTEDFLNLINTYEFSGLNMIYKLKLPSKRGRWVLVRKLCGEDFIDPQKNILDHLYDIEKFLNLDEHEMKTLEYSEESESLNQSEIEEKILTRRNSKVDLKVIRDKIWSIWCCDKRICFACESEISKDDWHCGHILAESKGGNASLDNLRPLCPDCNRKMRTTHMYRYIIYRNLPSVSKLPRDDLYYIDAMRKYRINVSLIKKLRKLRDNKHIKKGKYKYLRKELLRDYTLSESKIYDTLERYIVSIYETYMVS